jgi:DNA polymerase-1
MELRVVSILSKDQLMSDAFRDGVDIHDVTRQFCGLPDTEDGRVSAKTINFGIVYQVSVRGLVEQTDLSESQAKAVHKLVRETYPGIFKWLDEQKKVAINVGEGCSSYGRWRRVPGATNRTGPGRHMIREYINFLIQSVASDIVQDFGWLVLMKGKGKILPIISQHDGLVFDVRKEDYDWALDILRECVKMLRSMTKKALNFDLTVPLVFEVESGPSWYHQEPIKDASGNALKFTTT